MLLYHIRHIFLLTIVALAPFISSAQVDKREFEEGNLLMEEKFFNQALTVWLKLQGENPDNANINYKVGYSYLNSSYDKSQALPFLELASLNVSKNWMDFDAGEEGAPIEALFYLGQAYHLNEKLDEAIGQFGKFKASVHKKHYLIPLADRYVEWCEDAKQLMKTPIDATIENLGGRINGEFSDYSAVLSVDEGSIFFTSRRIRSDSSNRGYTSDVDGKYYEDIYVSYKDINGNWQEPEIFQYSTRPNEHEATISVTIDGQTLFLYKDGDGNGDIFQSKLIGDTWTYPEKLGSDINTNAWETHVTLSADGNTLYFVSDRKGGLGGRDIYRCVRLPNGEWSKSLNLGAPINTPHDEEGPFLHPDGKTMYFSSNGHRTMGGFDIFKSILEKSDDNLNGTWTAPINIGYPINTVDDDIFYVVSADDKRGYYASEKGNGFGDKDIYQINFGGDTDEVGLAVLKGRILTVDSTPMPDNMRVYLVNMNTGTEEIARPRSRDGVWVSLVQPCTTYDVQYAIDDSTVYSREVEIPCGSSYKEIDFELFLSTMIVDGNKVYNLNEQPTSTANVLENTIHWQLLYKDLPYDRENAVVTYLDENGIIKFTEKVGSQGMFKYQEIPGIETYIFGVEVEDDEFCDDMDIILVDEHGTNLGTAVYKRDCRWEYNMSGYQIVEGSIEVAPADYIRKYKYNAKGIAQEEIKWNKFVDDVAEIVKLKGNASVTVEGSASKVPTRSYGTNENLSQHRTEAARVNLLNALKERDVDTKKVKFIALNSLVQGPPYKTGAIRPIAEYERYQYIKMHAE
jgi:hypothetical protein